MDNNKKDIDISFRNKTLADDDKKPDAKAEMTKEEKAKELARNMAARSGGSLDSDLSFNSSENYLNDGIDSNDNIDDYVNSPNYANNESYADYDDYADYDRRSYADDRGYDRRSEYDERQPARRNDRQEHDYHFKDDDKKKKKSGGKGFAVFLITLLVLIIGAGTVVYLVGINNYSGKFLDNTYINGINVSGLSKEDAYKKVSAESTIPDKITLKKADDSVITVKLLDIGYVDETKDTVNAYYTQQNHYKWFMSKVKDTEFKYVDKFSYDKTKLEAEIERKISEGQTATKPKDAYIKKSGKGFVIVDEVDGNTVDKTKLSALYSSVEKQLDEYKFDIDISSADCYTKPSVVAADLKKTCDKLNELYTIEITMDFSYATETISGETIMNWITFKKGDNADNGYTADEDKVMVYVEKLAKKYDTYRKDRKFKSTKKGTITVKGGEGCYGWWIDQEKTTSLIVDLIEEGKTAKTKPIYYTSSSSGYSYTADSKVRTADKDWGNTYIEVDLYAQHLWYYKNGKLKMQTDIVSGYLNNSKRLTPEGVYKVWYKERNKTLTGSVDGQSYSSFVNYWNNISTMGIGLHDASWQNGNFGGSKYKTSTWGSHGCINMPYDKAKYVYENIAMGTPVFIYYEK